MNRILSIIFILAAFQVNAQNLQLRSTKSYGSSALANIGGYVDSTGIEYALVGTDFGLDIVDVSDPTQPVSKFVIPGATSEWREVKTYRKYAYITTEGGGGLTVADLSHLPDTVYYQQYTGDGAILGQLNSIHALHCDTAKGYLYLYGSNINGGNTLFLDLADPYNPHYAGSYEFPGSGNDSYVHDGIVENDTMYECHIYSGFFTIVDVTDKANPVLLATQTTPTAFTHNSWLSNDHHTLFTTDENSGSFLAAYDITDPANIHELSRFQTAPGSGAIVHNTQIIDNYSVTSWYKEGVVIVDEARPLNPIEVGHYDTTPTLSGDGFEGVWGVYPYLPSKTIVVSDIYNGLFVLTPTYVRGCYLEGIVSDSITSQPLNNATVEILTAAVTRVSNIAGEYYSGTAVAGTYSVTVTRAGYYPKTVTGVVLANGILTPLNIALSPLPSYSISGNISEMSSGIFIPSTEVRIENADLSYSTTADLNGHYNLPNVVAGTYTLSAGEWGHKTICTAINVTTADTIDLTLEKGYFDDFTFDFGWSVTGTSPNAWERAVPVGTYDGNGVIANIDADINSDCGTFCFVTDNGGAPYNAHDVDNGNTIITSPFFNGLIYVDPVINYYRYFINNNGTPPANDSLNIYVSNGTTTALLETATANDPFAGMWKQSSFNLSQAIQLTSTMQLIVETADALPGNIVEAAFDDFDITGQLSSGIASPDKSAVTLNAYPNPFSSDVMIDYDLAISDKDSKIFITDICGRVVEEHQIFSGKGEIHAGAKLYGGIYFVTLQSGTQKMVKKLVKN